MYTYSLCVYVCIYVCMCVSMCVCVYLCVYVCMYAGTIHTYVCTHTYISTPHTHITTLQSHICKCTHEHVYLCAYAFRFVRSFLMTGFLLPSGTCVRIQIFKVSVRESARARVNVYFLMYGFSLAACVHMLSYVHTQKSKRTYTYMQMCLYVCAHHIWMTVCSLLASVNVHMKR